MSDVPDKMPDDVEHDPHYFVDKFLEEMGVVLMRYDGALSRSEKLGAIEMFKLEVVASWREDRIRAEADDD